MKPCNLVIQGINSYVTKQTINFEELSKTNIFGIFGETGSGKSTILDCIIYALYGSCDRDNKLETFMNLNSNFALVEFEFEFQNPATRKMNRYKVTRTLKKMKSGIKTYAELVNVTENIVVAEDSNKVNSCILNLIRIGKKEFKRCIALPQGEFDEFLLSTPSEKKASIAKLFDAEIYGKKLLEVWNKRKQEIDANLNLINAKIVATDVGDVNSVEELQTKLKELVKTKNDNIVKINRVETQLAILMEEFDNYNKLVDTNKSLNELKLKEKDMIILEDRIVKYDNYSDIINVYNSLLEVNKSLAEAKEKYLKSLEAKESLQKKLINVEEEIESISKKEIESLKLITALETTLKGSSDFIKKTDLLKTELDELKNSYAGINESLTSLQQNLKDKLSELDNAENVNLNCVQIFNYQLESVQSSVSSSVNLKIKEVLELLKDLTDVNVLSKESCNILNKAKNILISILNENNNELDFKNVVLAFENLEKSNNTLNNLKTEVFNLKALVADKTKEQVLLSNKIKNMLTEFNELNLKVKENENNVAELNKLKIEKEKIDKQKSKLINLKNEINFKLNTLNNEILLLNSEMIKLEELSKSKNKDLEKFAVPTNNISLLSEELNNFNKEQSLQIVENYKKQILLLEKQQEELSSLNLREIAKEDLDKVQKLNLELKSQNEIIIKNIGKLENELENISEKQSILNKYLKEKQIITEKLNTYNDLNKYICRNQLSDFVAEEYLQIVTDIANVYIDELSDGKYEIVYSNGEFNIIDNFNAGLMRGVKSLSGGERFIVSLCLSLGISRALSKNVSKAFNFLFIDEGFGSLSEKYLSSVLDCFDSLIRMNFTIGIITHVDKLKDYVINKIEVEKVSSEQGSVVTIGY